MAMVAMSTPPQAVVGCLVPPSHATTSGWERCEDNRQCKVSQGLRQQHLVEFQGRTLSISGFPQVSRVLEAVYEELGVSKRAAAALEVPWRVLCGGRFLKASEIAPEGSILRIWTGGLKGGKGGFGAMLRAMAKQAR